MKGKSPTKSDVCVIVEAIEVEPHIKLVNLSGAILSMSAYSIKLAKNRLRNGL